MKLAKVQLKILSWFLCELKLISGSCMPHGSSDGMNTVIIVLFSDNKLADSHATGRACGAPF